jgi:hypothetical protein
MDVYLEEEGGFHIVEYTKLTLDLISRVESIVASKIAINLSKPYLSTCFIL